MPNRKLLAKSELCRDCQACILACSLYHDGECNPQLARLVVAKDMARYSFSIYICQQCDSPDCALVCPTDAMPIDGNGLVQIIADNCIQCGACMAACPHNAIVLHKSTGRYLKCDLCEGRPEGPVCVELCPVAALSFSVEPLGAEA